MIRWTESADHLTYTFTLRDNLAFSDGTLVTSEDVIASWTRWAETDGAGMMINTFLAGLDAVDAKTFRIRLKEPFGPMLLGDLGATVYKLESPEGDQMRLVTQPFNGCQRGKLDVVVDLKMQAFRPEFAGKMKFYLSAVNDLLRHEDDQPSIGLILCKTRDRVVAEYSLQDVSKPIGVSEYQLAAALPEKLKGTLPKIEELEDELSE